MGETVFKSTIEGFTWSYSRMSSFDDCPYKWYLKYLCGEKGKDMFFAQYGTFVHELLADFYEGKFTADDTYLRYIRGFKYQVNVYYPNRNVWRRYFENGADYLKNLSMPADRKVVGVEKEVHFEVDGVPFIGFIDRLDQFEDGSFAIVDHKSRILKPRSGRKKPTKSDEELDKYLRQLYLYSRYLEQEMGVLPTRLCINSFRSGTFIEEPFHEEVYREVLRWAVDEVRMIEQEEEFPPEIDWFRCTNLCEVQDFCEYYQQNKGK